MPSYLELSESVQTIMDAEFVKMLAAVPDDITDTLSMKSKKLLREIFNKVFLEGMTCGMDCAEELMRNSNSSLPETNP